MQMDIQETRPSGYYLVIASYGNSPEIAYYSAAKKWLYNGSQLSFTPHKVIKKVNV